MSSPMVVDLAAPATPQQQQQGRQSTTTTVNNGVVQQTQTRILEFSCLVQSMLLFY
jgi:hypothetical protein